MAEKRGSVSLLTTIRESEEKRNSYITITFTLLVVVLLIVFAIRPTITTITKIKNDIKEKENITKQLDKRIKTLSALDQEFKSSKEKFDSLRFVFPVSERYILLLSNIDSIVSRNGYKLNSINFDSYDKNVENITPTVIKPSVLSLSVSGTYSNFINLLKDLESLPMYAVIENVSFSGRTSYRSVEDSYSIRLRIYHVQEPNFYTLK